MSKQRFWASRDGGWRACAMVAIWERQDKPKSHSSERNYLHEYSEHYLLSDNPGLLYLIPITHFANANSFNIPKGRCIEITDPRVKQIRSK